MSLPKKWKQFDFTCLMMDLELPQKTLPSFYLFVCHLEQASEFPLKQVTDVVTWQVSCCLSFFLLAI